MGRQKSQASVDEILQDVRNRAKEEHARTARQDDEVDAILASLGMGKSLPPRRRSRSLEQPSQPAAQPAPSAGQQPEVKAGQPSRQTGGTRPQGQPAPRAAQPKPRQAQPAPKAQPVKEQVRPAPQTQLPSQPVKAKAELPSQPVQPKTQLPTQPVQQPAAQPAQPVIEDAVHGFFNSAKDNGLLEDPSELLKKEERFRSVFSKSVSVIPGEKNHAFEDTGDWTTDFEQVEKKKRWSFFGKKKDKAKAQPAPEPQEEPAVEEEPLEIEPYQFGAAEEPQVIENLPGQQYYNATTSIPKVTATEQKKAWSEEIDLPSARDASYTSAWARAETRREGSFQFGKVDAGQLKKLLFSTGEQPAPKKVPTGKIQFGGAQEPVQQPAAPAPAPAPVPEQHTPTGEMNFFPEQEPQEERIPTGQMDLSEALFAQEAPQEQAAPAQDQRIPTGQIQLTPEEGAETAQPLQMTAEQQFVNTVAENIISDSMLLDQVPLDEEDQEEETGTKTGRKGLARLLGVPQDEEENQSPFEEVEDTFKPDELVDDYNKPEDAPGVAADLADMAFHLKIRTVVTGALSLILLYLALAAEGFLPAISAVDPAYAPQPYLAANLILLAVGAVISQSTLLGGFQGLFGQPNPDSIPALATLASALQLVLFLVMDGWYKPGEMSVYAPVALLLLCFNSLGKSLFSRVARDNFELVSNGVDHAAAYRLRDNQLVRELAKGLDLEKPDLLLSRPTVLVRGFLTNTFSQRKSDSAAKKLSLALLGTALACALISGLIQKNGGQAITAFAAVFCLGGPLAGTLLSAIPEAQMQKHASRVGAVVPGWNSIRQLCSANTIQVATGDLFPSGSIKLHGIKTFEKERIDLAIVYAASILVEGCDTLRNVFLGILQNDRRLLLPVENLTAEIGAGFLGWIQNNRVIVGNRYMMEKYQIPLPDLEFEKHYTANGRRPIYLSVSGKLFGMFLVSYEANPEAYDALTSLNAGGVNFLVTGTDFLVDAALVEDTYGLIPGTVKLLDAEESDLLAPNIAWLSESEGCMIHMGSFASYAGGMLAAWGAARGEKAAALAMEISVLISCVLSIAFCCLGSFTGLSLLQLLLYQAAWTGITLALPLIQKYR